MTTLMENLLSARPCAVGFCSSAQLISATAPSTGEETEARRGWDLPKLNCEGTKNSDPGLSSLSSDVGGKKGKHPELRRLRPEEGVSLLGERPWREKMVRPGARRACCWHL